MSPRREETAGGGAAATAAPRKALRETLEERERLVLAPYALKAAESKGRRYPEAPDPMRTDFQRDRDRIVHCTAFRRLEYKTQVFVNNEGDHYRTRLTHSMEVAQIARSIARALRLNEDLVEALALVHDLGHPPFGHAGERALQEMMKDHGGFEHNRQALRVVDLLERRYAAFPGLNLTAETRESILKHKGLYATPEAKEFAGAAPNPFLEAQVVDVSDRIAYNNHDVDDGLYSGLLSEQELDEVAIVREVRAEVAASPARADKKLSRYAIVRKLIGRCVNDVVQASAERIEASGAASPLDARRADRRLVGFSDGMEALQKELGSFLMRSFYRHYRVMRMQSKAERCVSRLFTAFTRDPRQLPPGYQAAAEREGLHRTVCDYIGGMTDRYAQDEYRKLFYPFERL